MFRRLTRDLPFFERKAHHCKALPFQEAPGSF